MDCLFCKIAKGDIKANIIYQDDNVLVFDDIHPHAPHHKIVIPRKHISTLNDAKESDANVLGQMVLSASKVAKTLGIDKQGYRLVSNCNDQGGQTVFHIHMHLLGGRDMKWPPG